MIDDLTETLLSGIKSWVEVESPTNNPLAVNRMMDQVERDFLSLGVEVERYPGNQRFGDHLKVSWNKAETTPGILVLCHLDTVHPLGTLKKRPFSIDRDWAYGPGVFDMKSGAYLTLYALKSFIRQKQTSKLPVNILFTSDEEEGSPSSRQLIETEAKKAKYCLVMEPAVGQEGAVKTARKGWGRFTIQVSGKAAHAGADHQNGRSAIVELAHQILFLESLTDYKSGLTVNVGVVQGGTGSNVVPEFAKAEVDVRIPTEEEQNHILHIMNNLLPKGTGITINVTGGVNRPPFVRSKGVESLYLYAKGLALDLGFDLPEIASGGVSDGNFTAHLGIPTLDGLGPAGLDAHSERERIYIPSLSQRALLLMKLLLTLE